MPTFYEQFLESARRFPDNVALEIQRQDRVERVTFAELTRMSESVGAWLSQRVAKDARVAILAANHPRWVAVYLGVIAAGCTAVPLDTALNQDQVKKLLADSGTSLVFCDSKNRANAKFGRGDSTRIVLIDKRATNGPASLDSIIAAGPGNFAAVSVAPDSVASLLYTSGTTADPKGVMLTQ